MAPIWSALTDLAADATPAGIPYLPARQWILDRGLPLDWTMTRIRVAYSHYQDWSTKVQELRDKVNG